MRLNNNLHTPVALSALQLAALEFAFVQTSHDIEQVYVHLFQPHKIPFVVLITNADYPQMLALDFKKSFETASMGEPIEIRVFTKENAPKDVSGFEYQTPKQTIA